MCYARVAASVLNAYCLAKFPDFSERHPTVGRANMASTMANGEWIDAFDHQGGGSHKYIPADRLTEELGEPKGAGVYGYWLMKDGSKLLRTCRGPLAWWSGKDGERAQWGDYSEVA